MREAKRVMGKLKKLMTAMTTDELITFTNALCLKFRNRGGSHSSTSPVLLAMT